MPRMQVTDRKIVKMTAEEYHKLPHISSTQIRCFKQEGPWQFYHKYVGKTVVDGEESDDLLFGRAVHAVLEGRKLTDVCVSEPEEIAGDPVNRRLKKHREYLLEWRAMQESGGKMILSAEAYSTVAPMVEMALSNPAVRDLLRHECYREIPSTAKHRVSGIEVKALADVMIPKHPQGPTIVDWKTTSAKTANDCITEGFRRWAYNYQAAWYSDVFGATYFKFVFIVKKLPYDVFVFNVPGEVLSAASEANDQALIELKDCFDTNSWHSMGWGAEMEFSMSERFHQ